MGQRLSAKFDVHLMESNQLEKYTTNTLNCLILSSTMPSFPKKLFTKKLLYSICLHPCDIFERQDYSGKNKSMDARG